MQFTLEMVQFTFYYHFWTFYIMHNLMSCTPLSLISSSLMKLRCEYYSLYLLFIITNIYLRDILRLAANLLQKVMSPGISNSTMSAFSTNNSDTMTLVVLKLHDDGSNWADYEPCIQRALGSKGLWRHVEGTAIAPKLYALITGDSVGRVNCDPPTFLGVTDLTRGQTASDPRSSVTDHVLGRMGAKLDIM